MRPNHVNLMADAVKIMKEAKQNYALRTNSYHFFPFLDYLILKKSKKRHHIILKRNSIIEKYDIIKNIQINDLG